MFILVFFCNSPKESSPYVCQKLDWTKFYCRHVIVHRSENGPQLHKTTHTNLTKRHRWSMVIEVKVVRGGRVRTGRRWRETSGGYQCPTSWPEWWPNGYVHFVTAHRSGRPWADTNVIWATNPYVFASNVLNNIIFSFSPHSTPVMDDK